MGAVTLLLHYTVTPCSSYIENLTKRKGLQMFCLERTIGADIQAFELTAALNINIWPVVVA
jgi:hypothetical protein